MTVKGVRRNFARSNKPRVQRREVKKEELTDEQRDILKYISMNLDEVDQSGA